MELQQTKSGEYTLYIPSMDETYHSRDGAISEALHVFIDAVLQYTAGDVRILEVGLGTGLNALLTAINANENKRNVHYHTLEPFQVPDTLIEQVSYGTILDAKDLYTDIHKAAWEEEVKLSEYFTLHKTTQKLEYIQLKDNYYDIVYFDAFAPKKQPELWALGIFEKLYKALKSDGRLTTYSAAGQLKRDLKSSGFEIENPPGANGKREMTIAIKR